MQNIQNSVTVRNNPYYNSKSLNTKAIIQSPHTQTTIQNKDSVEINKPSNSVHTSWFCTNDIHGKMTRMERIFNICNEFANGSASKRFMHFFKGVNDENITKFKVAPGDVFIGANFTNNTVASEFLRWCKFDVFTPGNHEFDVPDPSNLSKLLDNTNCTILAANVNVKENSALQGKFKKSVVIERDGQKYGFIGICPSDMLQRVKMNESMSNISIQDVDTTIKTIQEEVKKLQNQGINKIVLLSHSGLKNDKRIAQETEGIDIIFGGHSHELLKDIKVGENLFFSKSGEPTVITQYGKDGAQVGILNVDFNEKGVITKAQNNVIDTMQYNRPLQIKDSVEKIIGKPEIVATVKSSVPSPKNRLIEDNPHGNLIADSMRVELGADIGLLNAANIRGHFSEGVVDSRLVADITPFEDKMMLLNLTEKQVVDMIKVGLQSFDKSSHKPGIMLVSGMKYTANKKGELLDLEYIDKNNVSHKIDVHNPSQTKKYIVATDDFIATGGDNYLPVNPKPDYVIKTFDVDKNKLACDYLKKFKEPIEIKPESRITIVD